MKDNYGAALEQARREFAQKNTLEMARASGAAFSFYPPVSWREFALPFLGRVYRVTWPGGEVRLFNTNKEASTAVSLIALHYLVKAGGKPPAGKWLPFRRLWGGDTFNPAFRKRALDPLADFYGKKEALFKEVVLNRLHGRPGKETNSFLVMALPRLPLLLRLESGDGEVPPRATILFDAAANEYLVTEDLAVLGEVLAVRLLRWGREWEQKKG